MDDYLEVNRLNWDERATVHAARLPDGEAGHARVAGEMAVRDHGAGK